MLQSLFVSVLLSLFEALSFTPMRASLYAENKKKNDKKSIFSVSAHEIWNRRISKISIFKKMDPIMERFLEYSTIFYERSIDFVLKFPRWIVFGSTILFIGSLGFFFLLKKEFIPPQDMGRFIVRARLPLGSSLQRTDEAMKKVEQYLIQRKEIEKYISNIGGFGGTEANTGMFFITMKEMGHRPKNPKTGKEITQASLFSILRKDLKELVPEATFRYKIFLKEGFLREEVTPWNSC